MHYLGSDIAQVTIHQCPESHLSRKHEGGFPTTNSLLSTHFNMAASFRSFCSARIYEQVSQVSEGETQYLVCLKIRYQNLVCLLEESSRDLKQENMLLAMTILVQSLALFGSCCLSRPDTGLHSCQQPFRAITATIL